MPSYFSYVAEKPEGMSEAMGPDSLPERLFPKDVYDSLGVDGGWMYAEIHFNGRRGWKIDWGAWCLPMTGKEIRELLGAKHHRQTELEMLQFNKEYLLVAAEHA